VNASTLISILIAGIGIGFLYALVSVGFYISFDYLNVLNIAYGVYVVFGAYCVGVLYASSITYLIAVPVAVIGAATMGFSIQKYLFTPISKYSSDNSEELIIVASFGLVFAFEQIFGNLFFYEPVSNPVPLSLTGATISGISIDTLLVVMGIISISIIAIFNYHLINNTTGKSIRAIHHGEFAARISGISPERTYNFTHLVVGGLTGLGGVLLSFTQPVSMTGTINITVIAFVVVMISGIFTKRSLVNLLWAGPIIGIITVFLSRFGYSRWIDLSTYLILLVLILTLTQFESQEGLAHA
jgi:branched-subunit amino acid ABC-type transport system permease component